MSMESSVRHNSVVKSDKKLGPVSDLEHYLLPDWWKRIFNSTYLKTDADVVDDQNITRQEVSLFKTILDLKDGDAILDLA